MVTNKAQELRQTATKAGMNFRNSIGRFIPYGIYFFMIVWAAKGIFAILERAGRDPFVELLRVGYEGSSSWNDFKNTLVWALGLTSAINVVLPVLWPFVQWKAVKLGVDFAEWAVFCLQRRQDTKERKRFMKRKLRTAGFYPHARPELRYPGYYMGPEERKEQTAEKATRKERHTQQMQRPKQVQHQSYTQQQYHQQVQYQAYVQPQYPQQVQQPVYVQPNYTEYSQLQYPQQMQPDFITINYTQYSKPQYPEQMKQVINDHVQIHQYASEAVHSDVIQRQGRVRRSDRWANQ